VTLSIETPGRGPRWGTTGANAREVGLPANGSGSVAALVVERVSDFVVRTLSRTGAVLCYHGVTTPQYPAAGTIHVGLDDLAGTLGALRDTCRIIPLIELVERHQSGQPTRGLLAITFDDAYATLLTAGGVLGALGIPVTVFPVGEATVNGSAFWWDRVEDVFPYVRPAQWRSFEEVCRVPDAFRRGQPKAFGPLRPFRQWMLAGYYGRWPARLTPHLADLEESAHRSTVQRSMTWAELEELGRQSEIHVGVHTLSHPVLPFLPDAEVHNEVAGCFGALSERLRNAVPILAAPYGLADARVVRLARAAGMLGTLSVGGTALGNAAPEWLPRICMSAGMSTWRLKLRMTGVMDSLRWRRGNGFPDLPSATT
jgi:peptidoglycan/xylan/chitin deacetylase (PgdA/CDA1 family)